MDLRTVLAQLPDDYEVVLKPRNGTLTYVDTAAYWLEGDGRLHDLDDFELVEPLHLPNGRKVDTTLPPHLRYYQPGDIGGHIPDPDPEKTRIGPIGEWVNTIEPETEASATSLNAGILAALGAWLGPSVNLRIGRIDHPTNILCVQVGYTGRARKGTADNEIRRFLHLIDPEFANNNTISGFGSGEALIERVSDPVYNDKQELVRGTLDQRLYIQEGEFSKVLRIADRQGSILSDVIRLVYDGTRISNVTKQSKLTSSHHRVSLFGGITPEELVALFPQLAATSGTGNRYLWVWSNPDKLLPDGGRDVDVRSIAAHISRSGSAVRGRPLTRTQAAVDWWHDKYAVYRDALHAAEAVRPIVGRATDQILRIAAIYAATEGTTAVDVRHLEAGEAWVLHSAATVQAVLGGIVRNPDAARILALLRSHPMTPATKKEIHDLFSRNTTSTAIDAAIAELERAGLAFSFVGESTGGRPPTLIVATTPVEADKPKRHSSFVTTNPDQKTLFVEEPTNHGKTQLVAGESENEKSVFTRGGGTKSDPITKEVSPDTLSAADWVDPF